MGRWKRIIVTCVVILGMTSVWGVGLAADDPAATPDAPGWRGMRGQGMQGRGMHGTGMRRGRAGRGSGTQGMGMRPGRGGRGMGMMMGMRRLNLTDEQVEKMKAIRVGRKDEAAAIGKRLGEAHRALREAVEGQDEAKIRTTATEVGKVIADRAVMASKVRAEIRAVLTPEQRKKADTLREARKKAAEVMRKALEETQLQK